MAALSFYKASQSQDSNGTQESFDRLFCRIDPKTPCVERRPCSVLLKAISIAQAALKMKVTQEKSELSHVISWKAEGVSLSFWKLIGQIQRMLPLLLLKRAA